jgi:hypothetical protein
VTNGEQIRPCTHYSVEEAAVNEPKLPLNVLAGRRQPAAPGRTSPFLRMPEPLPPLHVAGGTPTSRAAATRVRTIRIQS